MRLFLRLLLVALVVFSAACAPGPAGDPSMAAIVNGREIPVVELQRRFNVAASDPQAAEQLASDTTGELQQQGQSQILSQLIRTTLLEQGAAELQVQVLQSDIAAQRDQFVQQAGGEEALQQLLQQQNLTEEDLTDFARDAVLQGKISQQLSSPDSLPPDQLQQLYAQRYPEGVPVARHILVDTPQAAQQALQRLRAGEPFAKVAGEVSTDTGSAQAGGELGPIQPGQTVPEFEQAVFGAQPGQTVGPVQTEFGFHIIQRIEPPPLAEVADSLAAEANAGQSEQVVNDWLAQRGREANVQVNPRFGRWDPATGTVVPGDVLGDAPGAASEAELVPTEP